MILVCVFANFAEIWAEFRCILGVFRFSFGFVLVCLFCWFGVRFGWFLI